MTAGVPSGFSSHPVGYAVQHHCHAVPVGAKADRQPQWKLGQFEIEAGSAGKAQVLLVESFHLQVL